MRRKLKIIGRLCVLALCVVSVFFLYVKVVRGGFYPVYPAADFTNLSAPGADRHVEGDLIAQTEAGKLKGTPVESAVAFMGIPFARPPVGELRWEAPQPTIPWTGVRDATRPGPACTQVPAGLGVFLGPMAKTYGSTYTEPPPQSSEDCLYLNVWTREWPPKHNLPVMVWLHGGANEVGSGSQSMFSGVSLTARGVVLVTTNYRLGALGFFSHPELSARSPHHSSGNYGLLDQIAALRWVHDNIAQFGGDPQNVTLFGESAGAIDSAVLMTSPLAAGLFRRVISQSGPVFAPHQTLSQAEAVGKSVAELAPGEAHTTPLERLRALPAAEVAKLAEPFKIPFAQSFTVDGWVLPQSPQTVFLNGSIHKVDLLIGHNGREFSGLRVMDAATPQSPGKQRDDFPTMLKMFVDFARPCFGNWAKPVVALYIGDMLARRNTGVDRAFSDLGFVCPISATAALTSAAGQRVYVYRFDRSVPGKGEEELGAFHSLEVPLVFGALHDPIWHWVPFTPEDAALSNLVQTYWTNFAKSGDPNAQGLPSWPAWTDSKKEFLEIRKDARISAQRNIQPLFSSVSVDDLRGRISRD